MTGIFVFDSVIIIKSFGVHLNSLIEDTRIAFFVLFGIQFAGLAGWVLPLFRYPNRCVSEVSLQTWKISLSSFNNRISPAEVFQLHEMCVSLVNPSR